MNPENNAKCIQKSTSYLEAASGHVSEAEFAEPPKASSAPISSSESSQGKPLRQTTKKSDVKPRRQDENESKVDLEKEDEEINPEISFPKEIMNSKEVNEGSEDYGNPLSIVSTPPYPLCMIYLWVPHASVTSIFDDEQPQLKRILTYSGGRIQRHDASFHGHQLISILSFAIQIYDIHSLISQIIHQKEQEIRAYGKGACVGFSDNDGEVEGPGRQRDLKEVQDAADKIEIEENIEVHPAVTSEAIEKQEDGPVSGQYKSDGKENKLTTNVADSRRQRSSKDMHPAAKEIENIGNIEADLTLTSESMKKLEDGPVSGDHKAKDVSMNVNENEWEQSASEVFPDEILCASERYNIYENIDQETTLGKEIDSTRLIHINGFATGFVSEHGKYLLRKVSSFSNVEIIEERNSQDYGREGVSHSMLKVTGNSLDLDQAETILDSLLVILHEKVPYLFPEECQILSTYNRRTKIGEGDKNVTITNTHTKLTANIPSFHGSNKSKRQIKSLLRAHLWEIKDSLAGLLIGRRGERITKIEKYSAAIIQVTKQITGRTTETDGMRAVLIIGYGKSIEKAKKLISAILLAKNQ